MAWNRPTEAPKVAPKKPSAMRGIIAGLVVVAVAAVCIVIFMGKGEKSAEKAEKKPAKIKEVTPAATNRVRAVEVKKGPQPDENGIIDPGPPPNFKGSVITNDNGTVYYSPDPGFAERYAEVRRNYERLPFKTRADFEIASLLGQKPGAMVLETEFPANLEEDFKEHLNDKIEDLPTDSQRVKELKQMMREVKPQLMAAMEKGEKLADLLADYRRELNKAYALKENLQNELLEMQRKATSEDEIKDYINAANQMLDKYGVEHFPVIVSPGLKRRLELNRQEQEMKGEQ